MGTQCTNFRHTCDCQWAESATARAATKAEEGLGAAGSPAILLEEWRAVRGALFVTPRKTPGARQQFLQELGQYRTMMQSPERRVAEVPAITGCHAPMPTREAALAELAAVFQMIAEEYAERNRTLPNDTTEIVHA